MEQALREGGLIWRVLAAWADLRGSMRFELSRQPTEGRLLYYAVLSGLVWFLGQAAILAWGPLAPALTPGEFRARIGWELVTSAFGRTLALYALAAVGGALARAAGGGTGGWRDSRAAFFWAALVAAPAILAAHLLAILLTGIPGHAAEIADGVAKVLYGVALAHCLAEAHGFHSHWRVFAAIAALVAAFVGAFYLFGRLA